MGVYVVMPAFNEAGKIQGILSSMPATVDGRDVTVVVVDDGSTDGTGEIAEACGATLIRQPSNQGKGAALCRAIESLRDEDEVEAVVWMDGDGQHLPSSLPALVGPVLGGETDLCVGSRYLARHQPDAAPLNRRMVRLASTRAVEKITGFEVTDPFSGYRCFSKPAFDAVELDGCGYESELESSFAVARAGMRCREVAIPRIYGPDTSKMGHRHGRFRGRIVVVAGYVRTIYRAWLRRNEPAEMPIRV